MDKINIKDKISASLILGSYLDTLGFNNGTWEFNFGQKINNLRDAMNINYEIVHNFFALGGFNIDISKWNASDDTIMMIATMKACKKGGSMKNFIDEYVKILVLLEDNKRVSGISTINSLRLLAKYKSIEQISYSNKMGGNGAAMRTHYIGIQFKDDINKIIDVSIMASRLTHNYPLGFLGGMVTALFTNYAINNIAPEKWCLLLLELNENNTINKIVEKLPIYKEYMKDKDEFWTPWYKYKEYRLNNYDIKSKEFIFGSERFAELADILYENKNNIDYNRFGYTGASATIIAYDSILMSINNNKINWQSIVFNSTLNFTDSDTIGTITGCWYGALMGFTGVDIKMVNMLEFKKELSQS